MAVNRIGLLGGSFDPVHVAHIALAQQAVAALKLDQLQLIPAANPWQRAPLTASPEHRLAMLELACKADPTLHINTSEIKRGGPTYTIDTVRQLPPEAVYYWIIGADQLQNFCTWNDWEGIVQRVELAVAQRPGSPIVAPPPLNDVLLTLNKTLHLIDFPPMSVSATDIRNRLQHKQSTDGLLQPEVAHYIQQHSLYQTA